MVFLLALVIFQFISDDNQDIYFSIYKKKKRRKSLALIIFQLFSNENQDIYFSWPKLHVSIFQYLHLNYVLHVNIYQPLVWNATHLHAQ